MTSTTSQTRYLHSAPSFSWGYADSDGDPQYGYEVDVDTQSGVGVVDTGMVTTSNKNYTYPKATTPTTPSAWWNSSDWQFKWRVKVWDNWGLESPYSAWKNFDMVALERLRVSKIGTPPAGQTSPVLNQPSTHIMIDFNTSPLPKVKANGMVVLLFDSIGPVNSIPLGSNIYYTNITTGQTMMATTYNLSSFKPVGSKTNRWSFEIWTRPEPLVAGDTTIIKALLEGRTNVGNHAYLRENLPYDISVAQVVSTAYMDWRVILKGRKN